MKKNYADQFLRTFGMIMIPLAILTALWTIFTGPSKEDACECERILAYATDANNEEVKKCVKMFTGTGDIDAAHLGALHKCQRE